MSIRVSRTILKNGAAFAVLVVAASGLAGCSTFGMGGSSDNIVTGSTQYTGTSNLSQPMPTSLGGGTQVAMGPYTPPEDIGNGPPGYSPYGNSAAGQMTPSYATSASGVTASGGISSQNLPPLNASFSNGNQNAMSAQPNLAPVPVGSKTASLGSTTPAPNLSIVPQGSYTHVIQSGESLYTIARHYNVSPQAIMQASGISSPDKIYVGQHIVIPGRPDLHAARDQGVKAHVDARLPTDSSVPQLASANRVSAQERPTHVASIGADEGTVAPVIPEPYRRPEAASRHTEAPAQGVVSARTSVETSKPQANPVRQQTASLAPAPKAVAPQSPANSGADKFRWPVTGKLAVDFAASNRTGINIAAPEGTPVRAVENGTVIYVGNGVEGYGNLVLIRHPNSYVSAYADLKSINVAKGATVSRGDAIGTVGMTGSVKSPQLHFELRKGATPVDPIPLLAG